ncbi:MAG: hypothetical protein QG622_2003 [Actinomycetota bacterium]|nr:hypothetical protein [Actinomycetota bacterium]
MLVLAAVAAGVVLLLVAGVMVWAFSGANKPQRIPSSSPSPAPQARTIEASTVGGWYAGASGLGVRDGDFEKWLGQPVTISGTWSDTDDASQRELHTLVKEFKDWKGALDIAVGGTVLDTEENYAAAANGEYDERWREAAKVIAKARENAEGPTFIRPFHEMNGNWYKSWMVTEENSDDFKKAFSRYAGILREAMPKAYISWSPNYSDHTKINVKYWYPGDDAVDCVAPDYYDDESTPARVDIDAWNSEADDRDKYDNPKGPESWRQFAEEHGKPLCFPEWGLKPEGKGVDHPEWIKAVNAWMNTHANTATWKLGDRIPQGASGKVLYSVYFNVLHQDKAGFTIHGADANPKSEAVFPKLMWGNRKG